MRNILKRALSTRSEDQKGFTLIELLVVVGIIVALAAVIVPLVIQFAGKGDEGAWATEAAVVQAAVDTMMADSTSLAVVPPLTEPTIYATGENLGITGFTLGQYIRDMPTVCAYTVTTTGLVTQDVSAGATCE